MINKTTLAQPQHASDRRARPQQRRAARPRPRLPSVRRVRRPLARPLLRPVHLIPFHSAALPGVSMRRCASGRRHASSGGPEGERGPGGGARSVAEGPRLLARVGPVAPQAGGCGAGAASAARSELMTTRQDTRPTMRMSRERQVGKGEAEAAGERTAEGAQEVQA